MPSKINSKQTSAPSKSPIATKNKKNESVAKSSSVVPTTKDKKSRFTKAKTTSTASNVMDDVNKGTEELR